MVWSGLNGGFYVFEVEVFGFFGKVGVLCNWKVNIVEDLVMICLSWVGEVDCLVVFVEFGEEESIEMDGVGFRDCLYGGGLVFFEGR